MTRESSRIALYQALKKGQSKFASSPRPGQGPVVPLRRPDSAGPERRLEDSEKGSSGFSAEQQARRAIQGRIQFSISYAIAAILVLALILVVLLSFKVGRMSGAVRPSISDYKPAPKAIVENSSVVEVSKATDASVGTVSDEVTASTAAGRVPVAGLGSDHVIIIATYYKRADLVPAQKHFAVKGIATVIQARGSYYFLVTQDKYQSPLRKRTDGYFALQKIKRVGKSYTAPKGYETFAPNLFQDAYGEKVRNIR